MDCDILVCGAGITGLTIARLLVDSGLKVIVIEKRENIGGNCYDYIDSNGILIHKYGPHYFRTDNDEVYNFLSRFTEWIEGNYEVKALVDDQYYPIPINLTTLEMLYNVKLDEISGKELLEKVRDHNILTPNNSEQFVLKQAGKLIYEKFYKNYTEKQWGIPANELDPSVCGRLPIRYNRDSSYVDAKYKVMPRHGYTKMFEAMINHPDITVILNMYFITIESAIERKFTVITGSIDEYFGYCFGHLPYRSLKFSSIFCPKKFIQPCVQINYPNDYDFTRSVEYKHITGQETSGTSVIYEYPMSEGEPYYPIPCKASAELYKQYKDLAEQNKNVIFGGRMGEYRYINMDQAVKSGMNIAEYIKYLTEYDRNVILGEHGERLGQYH